MTTLKGVEEYKHRFNLETVSNTCQCCCDGNNLKSMNGTVEFGSVRVAFFDILKECFSVQVECQYKFVDNTLMICEKCITRLKECFEFKRQIVESQSKINNYLTQFYFIIKNEVKEEQSFINNNIIAAENNTDTEESAYDMTEDGSGYEVAEDILQKAIIRTQNNMKLLNNSSIDIIETIDKLDSIDFPNKYKESKIKTKKNVQKKKKNKKKEEHDFYSTDPNITDCHLCPEKFISHHRLVNHMSTHFPNVVCTDCGKTFVTRTQLRTHLKVHITEKIPCPLCPRKVKKWSLKRHIEWHNGGAKPYKCKFCETRFESHRQREVHLNKEHGIPERSYDCKLCDKKCETSGLLTQHVRSVHLCLRPHSCSSCSMSFFDKHHLNEHMRKHSNEKAYQCAHCPKSYTYRRGLRTHLTNCHGGVKQ